MKSCCVFLALFAVAHAGSLSYLVAPSLRSYPYVYGSHTSSYVTPEQQQYHTQDELGQYAYGYSGPLSSKQEVRSLDGVTRGSYSYRDANDILQTVDYHADDTGFHVQATNLPKPFKGDNFRNSEPSVSHTIAANTISSDTDTESIDSADTFGKAIYSTSGLRLAESAAAHPKSFADPANVRSLELSQPLANTIKVATTSTDGVFLNDQHRQVYVTSPVAVARIPITKTLLPKVYTYGYPLNKHVYSHGFYY